MTATLWSIILCILIDEKADKDFWQFAKKHKLLSNKQIKLQKPIITNCEEKENPEKPYILAATSYAHSPDTPQYVSEKIFRIIKKYDESN